MNLRKIKNIFIKRPCLENGEKLMVDVPLHGCALIFSKKYCEKYETVFYADTFLFHEEEFLNERRKQDNLVFVYNPELTIFHKEGTSVSTDYKDEAKKQNFRNKEIIKSLEKLLEFMK